MEFNLYKINTKVWYNDGDEPIGSYFLLAKDGYDVFDWICSREDLFGTDYQMKDFDYYDVEDNLYKQDFREYCVERNGDVEPWPCFGWSDEDIFKGIEKTFKWEVVNENYVGPFYELVESGVFYLAPEVSSFIEADEDREKTEQFLSNVIISEGLGYGILHYLGTGFKCPENPEIARQWKDAHLSASVVSTWHSNYDPDNQ